MHNTEENPEYTEARPQLPRLAELVAAARARRRSPEGLRDAVARRIKFLRSAAAQQVRQLTARPSFQVRDEVCAMAHVLRVRSRLLPEEQRAFDQLVTDYTQTMLALLVGRSDEEALEAVRRQLASVAGTMPAVP